MSNVALMVTGGIAAYKACEVLRGLQKAGHEVRVAMTADAERFVGTTTFEALTKHPVLTDLYGQHALIRSLTSRSPNGPTSRWCAPPRQTSWPRWRPASPMTH